jgi:DNA-binding transcriptional LysR family regulator
VICDTGNLISAAKVLGSNQPNIGRQMSALEKQVGFKIFIRHSRGMLLTQQGEEFRILCSNLFGHFHSGTDLIREKDLAPEGLLKISTGTGALDIIINHLPIFSRQYPKIRFCFYTTSSVFDYQMGNRDVSFSPVRFEEKESNLVQHHIFDMPLKIYASHKYIKENPPIKTLEDLRFHKLIAYEGQGSEFLNTQLIDPETGGYYSNPLLDGEPIEDFVPNPFIGVTNGSAMRNVLLKGLGVGPYCYDPELEEKGQLVDVFPDSPGQKVPYYFSYHEMLEESPKVKAFHNFINDILHSRKKES